MEDKFNIDYYDYPFDESLIAQEPIKQRDLAKLLVIHKSDFRIKHDIFRNILNYLREGDCIVLNNSKVVKARLIGKLDGQDVELFFTRALNDNEFEGIGKPLKKFKKGKVIKVGEYEIVVKEVLRGKRVYFAKNFFEIFNKYGKIPIPHYIKREPTKEDEIYYQTVYAKKEGSVASPTAGLHFTQELLDIIKTKGINIC
ncbi:MAG: S-adenosylmethionine:tRNA ribosyltransferase-isomerase, partial [candidate division WOR-3 bacterium]